MSDAGQAAQQLVELLAVVSSCDDEETAIRAAVERAAEAVEGEICCVVFGGQVATAVGLPGGSPDYARLGAVVPGRRDRLELPGMGSCSVGSAQLGGVDEGMLVLARADDDFSVAEHNLIRGMARVLGLTLRMLRTLEAERRRERLMRHLYEVQRSISRRVPLTDVLQTVAAAALEVIAGHRGQVELWLTDPAETGHAVLICRESDEPGGMEDRRRPVAEEWPVGVAIGTDQLHESLDGGGRWSIAAPVHEHGRTVGALSVVTSPGRRLGETDRENLLSFAEHISLALADAKVVRDMEAARHDPLTGLPGRALFQERLRDRLAEDGGIGQIALLFIDLDRFKAVNDTLGHEAGDALLTQLASRLEAVVRRGDLLGRQGGDEFTVALCPATEYHAVEVAGRIIDEVSRPYLVPGGCAEVGASIGIALDTDADERELVRRADLAMYQAKRAGRGRLVIYRPDEDDEAQAHEVLRQLVQPGADATSR
jgi:diguanylate cyclase (GGDEF)-like protein